MRHFLPDLPEEDENAIWKAAGTEGTPMGRVGQPAEVAAVLAFLASDESPLRHRAAYSVDGGYLAR